MEMSAPIPISLPPGALTALRRQAQARGMTPATLAHLMLVGMLAPDLSPQPPVARCPHPSLFQDGWDEGEDVILIEDD
ncbi:hypothetical protein HKCCE4037_04230 [Rhodobacterales bacterium HKCCE4037]|nr:hypothetical protein [Rhodobacterales bacterium HKCCE4037]